MAVDKKRFAKLATLMRCAASEMQFLYFEGPKNPESPLNKAKAEALRSFLGDIEAEDDLSQEDGPLRSAIDALAIKGLKTQDKSRLDSAQKRHRQRFEAIFTRARDIITEMDEVPESLSYLSRFLDVQYFQDEARLIDDTFGEKKKEKARGKH